VAPVWRPPHFGRIVGSQVDEFKVNLTLAGIEGTEHLGAKQYQFGATFFVD